MPSGNQQERWDVYATPGTKDAVHRWLEPGESLSAFVRAAVERELARRERRAAA